MDLDKNDDGKVSDQELANAQAVLALKVREEKAHTQINMAITALTGMCIYPLLLLLPLQEINLQALSGIAGPVYLGFGAVVAFVAHKTIQ